MSLKQAQPLWNGRGNGYLLTRRTGISPGALQENGRYLASFER